MSTQTQSFADLEVPRTPTADEEERFRAPNLHRQPMAVCLSLDSPSRFLPGNATLRSRSTVCAISQLHVEGSLMIPLNVLLKSDATRRKELPSSSEEHQSSQSGLRIPARAVFIQKDKD